MSYSKTLVGDRLFVWSDRHDGRPPPPLSRSAVVLAHGCQVDGPGLAAYPHLAARYPERFTTPLRTKLVFYCEDGEALENTIRERSAPFNMTTNCNSLIAVASDQTQPVQTVAGNEQVRNYFLSKNSGAATNFSYEIIRHYMHPDYRRDMIAAKRASQEIEPYAYEEYLERVRLYAPKKPFYSRSPWRKTGAGEVMVIKDFLKDCVFPMESQYFHEIVSDVITLTSPDELPTNEEYGFLPLTLKNAVALLEQAGYQYHTIHCLFCRSADETSPAVPLTRKKPRWRRFLSFQTGRRPTGQNGSPRLCRRLFANRPK